MKATPILSVSPSEHDFAASVLNSNLIYEEGLTLTLKACDLDKRMITVRVLKLYRPLSLACVMKVEFLHGLQKSDGMPSRAILKLYDRRFAAKLRADHRVDTWTSRHEDSYVAFVRSGAAAKFVDRLQQSEYLEEPVDGWGMAESETYLQGWCSDMYATELDAYQRLRTLQGGMVPKLLSTVVLADRSSVYDNAASSSSNELPALLKVHGLLIEYVSGPTLAQMPDFVAFGCWQAIVHDALKIPGVLADFGVVHESPTVTNIIASPINEQDRAFRLVMLDFSRCVIRSCEQTEEEWERLTRECDAQGIIGRSMSLILAKVGFDLKSEPHSL